MICRWGFLDKHIKCCTCNHPGLDSIMQRLLINKSTARAINQPHASLHFRKGICTNYPARFLSQRRMNGEEVGALEHFVKRHCLDFQIACLFGRDKRIKSNNVHAEASRSLGHVAPDPAQANDAQRLALELDTDEPFAFPLSGFETAVSLRHVSR